MDKTLNNWGGDDLGNCALEKYLYDKIKNYPVISNKRRTVQKVLDLIKSERKMWNVRARAYIDSLRN